MVELANVTFQVEAKQWGVWGLFLVSLIHFHEAQTYWGLNNDGGGLEQTATRETARIRLIDEKWTLPAAVVFALDQITIEEEVELCQASTRGHRWWRRPRWQAYLKKPFLFSAEQLDIQAYKTFPTDQGIVLLRYLQVEEKQN